MALDEITQICPVPLSSWAGDCAGQRACGGRHLGRRQH